MIRVLIADDHPLMREGIRSRLERQPDIVVVGEASNGEQAVSMAQEMRPDVVLMDLEMPEVDGLEATRRIRAQNLDAKVLVLTIHSEQEYVRGLLRAGANGYILKTTLGPSLVESVRLAFMGDVALDSRLARQMIGAEVEDDQEHDEARGGGAKLSTRQVQILKWIANGMSSRDMAKRMKVSERTAKGYVATMMGRLGVSSRAAAVAVAMRLGILKSEDIEMRS